MGWAVAKMAHDMGHPERRSINQGTAWSIFPGLSGEGEPLVNAMRSF